MTTSLTAEQVAEINRAIERGLQTLEQPEPLRLSEWAEQHFYLSSESSYIQGRWESFPYQREIMDCISNDDVREVNWQKSGRVGYTKIILAAIGYFAEHKKRNQAIFQPVDDDADDFCKSELDPMIRDVPVVQGIFPWFDKKAKQNTLRLKSFRGSSLYIRGGKAAKNYRRISPDVAYTDEIEAFDRNIEGEGSPVKLVGKRIEGSTFPKQINGSTPKKKGDSLIEPLVEGSDLLFRFHIPCPHCEGLQYLEWGGKDVGYGIKWVDKKPETAAYLCKECGALFTQSEYLDVCDFGVWMAEDGTYLEDGLFRKNSEIVDPPLSVGFHIWTAYSPMTSWSLIVREFLAAKDDRESLQTFVNTTLGETWEEDDSEKLEHETLYLRREHYKAPVPDDVVILTAGIDTQDDRFEFQVDGWGSGEERWTIDYVRLFGDPSRGELWKRLGEYLRRAYPRADGEQMTIRLACQDHGGHYSDEVTEFSRRMGVRFLIPVKGFSTYGNPVAKFPRKPNDKKVYLTNIGTDTAKELLYQRLLIHNPGPGYWHWPISEAFDEDYFRLLTNEERVPKWTLGKKTFVWDAKSRRQEPWDCSVYSLAAVRILQQHFGLNLEQKAPIVGPAAKPRPKPKKKRIPSTYLQ